MGSSGTISQVIVALRNPTSGPYREVTEKGTSMSMILSVNSASSTSTIDYNGPGIYSFPFNAAYSSGGAIYLFYFLEYRCRYVDSTRLL